MRRIAWMGAVCAASLAGLPAGVAVAQQGHKPAPTENRGLRYEALAALDLTGQIDWVAGRQLRLRRLTMEPGGHAGLHDHRDRPAMLYVVEGVVIDHRDGGGEPREYRAGQSITEPVETRHWIENPGDAPTVLIVVDLFRP
jgi:quercetin dioxygenase-like cupin family protein